MKNFLNKILKINKRTFNLLLTTDKENNITYSCFDLTNHQYKKIKIIVDVIENNKTFKTKFIDDYTITNNILCFKTKIKNIIDGKIILLNY